MVWTPKSSSPATFRLRDEFVALITGDATWGWLVDWAPYVLGDSLDTAAFCAAGPHPAVPLDPSWFVGPSDRSPIVTAAKLATLVTNLGLAANDRVFQAYCEIAAVTGAMTWGTVHCASVDFHTSGGGYLFFGTDPAAPWDALRIVSVVTDPADHQVEVATGPATNAHTNLGAFGTGGSALPYETGGPSPAGDNSLWGAAVATLAFSATVCWQYGHLNTPATDYVATPQPNPGVPIAAATGSTMDDLAHELDRQEAKLDFITGLLQIATATNPALDGTAGDPIPVTDPLAPVALVDAIGVVVALTGVPGDAIRLDGFPTQLERCGFINFGTARGWYPSIPITHTPMVVQPLPPGTTQMTATVYPPSSATITPILRPK